MGHDDFVRVEEAEKPRTAAQSDHEYYEMMAVELLLPEHALVLDFGCGPGGMACALRERAIKTDGNLRVVGFDAHPGVFQATAAANPDITFAVASFEGSVARMRELAGGAPDLIWARDALHHAVDEQQALHTLAQLLAPGGTLALAEGGTTVAQLPRHLGAGEPGLHGRLNAALDDRARAALDQPEQPCGWWTVMHHAGLTGASARHTPFDKPAPLEAADLDYVLAKLEQQLDWAAEHLSPEDAAAWHRLLDPNDSVWLGARADMFFLAAASVHLGHKPA